MRTRSGLTTHEESRRTVVPQAGAHAEVGTSMDTELDASDGAVPSRGHAPAGSNSAPEKKVPAVSIPCTEGFSAPSQSCLLLSEKYQKQLAMSGSRSATHKGTPLVAVTCLVSLLLCISRQGSNCSLLPAFSEPDHALRQGATMMHFMRSLQERARQPRARHLLPAVPRQGRHGLHM